MKVLIIGATGQTGRQAVEQLLARGDEVTAFARTPSAVTEKRERLRVVQGHARDADSIDQAVKGQDAVLVAFGPRSLKKDDVQEVLMRNLITAMKKHGVKRIVNLSAAAVAPTSVDPTFVNLLFRYILIPLLLRNVFADKLRGETLLFASGLDYVNVRPGRLLNSPARGGVRASFDGRGLRFVMTREDLAAFMIEQLRSDAWVRKSPLIGY
jgi:uncharacterized protein YbjT (DUF2867 family)